jgi:TIR domain
LRKLFVSYARENKPDVDQLVEHLRTMGYDTWVDAALRGGQDWWEEILDRIADTDVVIAIFSSAALNSTACRREFEWAVALAKPVVPVAVEPPPTALPRRFARRQIIDYSQPAQRDRAALQLQGALAALPPAPPLPDPLPEPPAAPLSYLTDLIDLITETGALDHDQQHQILHQLEPALTSLDPLERRGGRDILERFSRRPDLYADVDRAITRLRQLSDQPVAVDREPPTQTATSTAERSGVQADNAPANLAGRSADTSTQDVGQLIGATTALPTSAPKPTYTDDPDAITPAPAAQQQPADLNLTAIADTPELPVDTARPSVAGDATSADAPVSRKRESISEPGPSKKLEPKFPNSLAMAGALIALGALIGLVGAIIILRGGGHYSLKVTFWTTGLLSYILIGISFSILAWKARSESAKLSMVIGWAMVAVTILLVLRDLVILIQIVGHGVSPSWVVGPPIYMVSTIYALVGIAFGVAVYRSKRVRWAWLLILWGLCRVVQRVLVWSAPKSQANDYVPIVALIILLAAGILMYMEARLAKNEPAATSL